MTNWVITGWGIISNQGVGKRSLEKPWSEILSVPKKFTGFVPHCDPQQWMPAKYIDRTDRSNQLALAAVGEALQQAQLKQFDPHEVGVIVANLVCGVSYVEKQARKLAEEGESSISKYLSIAFFPCGTTGMISILHHICGFSTTLGYAHQVGQAAFQLARQVLEMGKARFMLVGATEAPLIPLFKEAYAQKYGPVLAGRLSEASCFFVLEAEQTAQQRNVPVLMSLDEMLRPDSFDQAILREMIFGNALSVNDFLAAALKLGGLAHNPDLERELLKINADLVQGFFREELLHVND